MDNTAKIVVIGANHAGTACINTILDNNKNCEVVVFDRNDNISFLMCGTALLLGDRISKADELFYSSMQALEEKGAKMYMETVVDSVDYTEKIVYATGKNGEKYAESYDKLVLATGSEATIIDVKGAELENIHSIKLFKNATEILEKLKTDDSIENVAIIGASYIGVAFAEAFQLNGKEVTLIDAKERCLANSYDKKFTDMLEARFKKVGIALAFGHEVIGYEGENGKVSAVVTNKGVIHTELVILAAGFEPNCTLGNGHLDVFTNGAYIVDDYQQTSDPNVYAIGDCATVKDNTTGGTGYAALVTNAVRSGMIAGSNICGVPLQSAGVQGSNAVSVLGLNLVSTGLSVAKAQEIGKDVTYSDVSDLQRAAYVGGKYAVDFRVVFEKETRRIVGAQVASEQDVSMGIHVFSLAIQEGITIDKLKLLDVFFLPQFNQPYNYIIKAALAAPNT